MVLCFTSVSFLIFTLRGIIYGETAGEGHDNDVYRKEAKARNEVNKNKKKSSPHPLSNLIFRQEFVNTYDCGFVLAIALSNFASLR